jgi:hypothetical protein
MSGRVASAPFRPDRLFLAAGLLQLASSLAPAARVRVAGGLPFHQVPSAGPALLALGVFALVVALHPRGWWRWLPGGFTAAVLAVAYWRLARAPSASFLDPILRHAVDPSWGFVPMALAALLALVAAARVRVRPAPPAPRGPAPL